MTAHPNTSQADRDLPADIGLADFHDRAGTGEQAEHDEEPVA